MAIAIDRRLIRGMGNFDKSSGTISKKDSDDLTLAHIFQSGHHEDIESRCYGLSAESLLGTSESTLYLFRQVSHAWHKFFQRRRFYI
ncbi:hypothetical protein ACJ72_06315 [Emergomyces africanus]|uniref:Uncharacterized protein n=1 Tax=Emergomyces africanus TaxID=1955775 RepID=A0A1B7NRF7_9EURO|nr:hypothetical protein ACJ72_06315 [Emergomyces africanus]